MEKQLASSVDGWVDGWIMAQAQGLMSICMDEGMGRQMDGWVARWTGKQIEENGGWVDRWMDGWVNGGMN